MGTWRAWLRTVTQGPDDARLRRTLFVPPDDVPRDQLLTLHRVVVEVLRASDDSPDLRAWIDCISGEPWPDDVHDALHRLRGLGGSPDAVAVDVDLADPADRNAFLALSPYTIGAEIWSGMTSLVFGAADTGTGTFANLTPTECDAVAAALDAQQLGGLLLPLPDEGGDHA
jgi:hypothetical protein